MMRARVRILMRGVRMNDGTASCGLWAATGSSTQNAPSTARLSSSALLHASAGAYHQSTRCRASLAPGALSLCVSRSAVDACCCGFLRGGGGGHQRCATHYNRHDSGGATQPHRR